jgi:hypothetical protein
MVPVVFVASAVFGYSVVFPGASVVVASSDFGGVDEFPPVSEKPDSLKFTNAGPDSR